MKYQLNPSFRCNIVENELVLNIPDHEPVCISEGIDEFLSILELFIDAKTVEEVFDTINLKYYISKPEFNDLIDFMVNNNILKAEAKFNNLLSSKYYKKYARQLQSFTMLDKADFSIAETMQYKIENTSIALLGVGGTGSYFALSMIMLGIKKIVLVDYDHIELSNVSRQVLYNESDVGLEKLVVAKEKLQKYNPDAEIKTYSKYIQKAEDLEFLKGEKIDILVSCIDTPRGTIQKTINSFAQANKLPWMLFGPSNNYEIIVGPIFLPNENFFDNFYSFNLINENTIVQKINDNFIAAVMDPYNALSADIAAIEMLKYITNMQECKIINKSFIVNTKTWNIELYE